MMIKTLKPTSKVIQISTCFVPSLYIRTALCEDGSMWQTVGGGADEKEWSCILEPYQPSIPVPGSKWIRLKDNSEFWVSKIFLGLMEEVCVALIAERGSSREYQDLGDFLKLFEPKP
jgi:hypothetical protein